MTSDRDARQDAARGAAGKGWPRWPVLLVFVLLGALLVAVALTRGAFLGHWISTR